MHHASKTILKLFTPFHPRQLSCERTYARSHPAGGAGARSSAGFPGPWRSDGLAPHGRGWWRGVFLLFLPTCALLGEQGPSAERGCSAVLAGRRRPHHPVLHHGFKVLQLQSSRSASAETFLRSSLCSRFSNGMWGQGQLQHWEGADVPSGWQVGCVGFIGRNRGA